MIAKNEHRILWLPGETRSWDDDGGGGRNAAGVRIDASNAHTVAAVFACLRILGETVASLPLHVLERLPEGGKRPARSLPLYRKLHLQPNAWQTSFEWREQAVFHVGLWGDAFSLIVPGPSGYADSIEPLHPSRMKIERIENGRLRYKYREDKGQETIYTEDQILHIRGPSDDGVRGLSIVEECKDAIALARACELHGARYFAAGARPGFVLSTDGQLNAEAREQLRSQWDRRHGGVANSHNTAVLTGGLRPYEIPQASNSDSQFLEAREYQLREIARLFRIPGFLLGITGSAGNPEHAGLDFVQHTILPWLRRFESAFMRDLILDDDRYQVEFDVRGLLRADASSRSAYYRAMWDIGALSTNDILELENRNPVEGGDVRYRPLNMGTLGERPTETDVLAQQQPGSGIDGQAVEGGLDAAAGGAVPATPGEPEAPQVADVSLNGAQITGLIAILQQVPAGLITKDAAAALITASFPSISMASVQAILAGVSESAPPAAAPVPQPPVRSLPEARSLTISIDFDRTFAADPKLWGEFAEDAVENGNTVVMVSRREDTPENQQVIKDTLGEWAGYFSQVMLIGTDTLKDDAAKAAGVAVDVWVDDSPQFIRSEQRAEPGTVAEGDFVSWNSSGGRARGRVDHVMDYGTLDIPDTDFKIEASKEDPAALITVYEEVTGGWRATDTKVGHKVSTLTKIDPLPEPDEKRDCGANATGGGGFQPGNSCGKGGGGSGGGSDGGGGSSGSGSGGGSAVSSGGSNQGSGEKKTPAKKQRKERLRDRIEGTQAEADREVSKIARKQKDLQKKIDALKSEVDGSAAKARVAAAQKNLADATAKAAAARAKVDAIKAKISALKSKRAKDKDEKELEGLLKEMATLMDEIAAIDKSFADIEKSLNEV